METGGWENSQLAEILKRLEQVELRNQTRDAVVGTVQKEMQEVKMQKEK